MKEYVEVIIVTHTEDGRTEHRERIYPDPGESTVSNLHYALASVLSHQPRALSSVAQACRDMADWGELPGVVVSPAVCDAEDDFLLAADRVVAAWKAFDGPHQFDEADHPDPEGQAEDVA